MKQRTFAWAGLPGLLAVLLVAACGSGSAPDAASAGAASAAVLQGSVHGGQQPVSGAQVTAYAAGDGELGSNATALACVSSNASGAFTFGANSPNACAGSSLPTTFACPSANCAAASSEIYLIAVGGNPGLAAGTNNSALKLMAALGPYSSLAETNPVNITELSTAAAAYSLAQMMGTPAASCIDCSGTQLASRLAQAALVSAKSPQLDNAFARANSLVNYNTSAPGTAVPPSSTCTGAGGSGSDPVNCGAEEKLNSVADALAACVNSSGPSSTGCTLLFCAATPGSIFALGGDCDLPTGGAIAADTLQSALAVALNPGTIPNEGLFFQAGSTPPFTPALSAAPNDWTLALNFSGGGLYTPEAIAIDAAGNVWAANYANVTELNNLGAPVSGSPFSGNGSLDFPNGIAIDESGNVWVTSVAEGGVNYGVTELSSRGVALSPANTGWTGGGLNSTYGIAIDQSGNVWVVNSDFAGNGSNSVTELDNAGMAVFGSPFSGGGLDNPYYQSVAIDGSGNVWVSNYSSANGVNGGSGSVTELDNAGVAVSNSPFSTGGLDDPSSIAIDAGGNVWVANLYRSNVTKLNSSGTPAAASPFSGGGLDGPYGLAIDGGGNAWAANITASSVTELSNSGVALSPSTGFTGGGLVLPFDIAIDAGGNVWIVNQYSAFTNYVGVGNGSVTELIGAAVPKKTPFIGPPQSP